MPFVADEREYRDMPVMVTAEQREEQLINTDYYVEGYATTFDEPYLLFREADGTEYYEQMATGCFDTADTSDVIYLHNHEGKCLARNKMKKGKPSTLMLEVRPKGFFVAADLGTTPDSRAEYEAITGGLVYQMSFAFAVSDAEITELGEGRYLRTVKSIRKVYDVSSVDQPANPYTSIDSVTRSAFEGFINEREQERLKLEREIAERQKVIAIIKLLKEA